jgi:cell division septum initiation protein DivIVA
MDQDMQREIDELKHEVAVLTSALLQVQQTLVTSFTSHNTSINAHTQAIDTHTAQLSTLTPISQATVLRLQGDPEFATLLKRILEEISANQNASTIPDSALERSEQYLRRIVPAHLLP